MDTPQAVRRLGEWDAEILDQLSENHETPLYVMDLDRVRENLERLQTAFPDAAIHYAVKANAGNAVLETFAAAGIGAECASWGEVSRAMSAGFDGEDILYTPVNPPSRDLDAIVETWRQSSDLTITAGARDTIERLADRDYDGRIAIRIHPGIGAGHDDSVSTGADAKFGVPVGAVQDNISLAETAGMDVVGLHAHVGSGIFDEDLDAHRAVVSTLAQVASEIGPDLEFVDAGGGFGVPYRPETHPLDLDRVASVTAEALSDIDAAVVIEPGRYLVADAGVLLTTVNTVKEIGSGYLAGVDAGMTDLLRPALYDAFHDIRLVDPYGDDREMASVSVVGPICESTDIFAEDRRLPIPEKGDLLAIGNAGAYGIEMASQYNSRPRPAVVAIEDGRSRLVRRRETVADITACEVDE